MKTPCWQGSDPVLGREFTRRWSPALDGALFQQLSVRDRSDTILTMLTTPRQQLILDMLSNRTSEDEFLREIGIARGSGSGFALSMLEGAYRENNKVDVEFGLYLGFRFGFTLEFLDVLIRLSDADWHQRHEDVVTALDKLRDVRATDAFYRATLKLHTYLDYDDSRALASKAIWALGRLGDATADQRLRSLAESGEPVVRAYAREQLYRRSGRVTPEEKDRGKTLCERLDSEKDEMLRAQLLRELHELNECQKAEEKKWMAEQGWENP